MRSRLLALLVLCFGQLMIILDGSIVTVALPAIQTDLGFDDAGLTWVVNAYLMALAGLLLLGGRLGDLLGHRTVLIAGLAVFTIASVFCGLASEPWMLVAARFVQGAGGALFSAVGLGMIAMLFTEPGERAKAIGAFAFTGAVGASLGQVLGGLITDTFGWAWIFGINLPIGVLAVALSLTSLPGGKGLGLRAGADVPGAVLGTGGLMLGVYAIVHAEGAGWSSPTTAGGGLVALALLAGFVRRQATARTPLLPLRVLKPRAVWAGNLIQMLMVGGMFSFQLFIALYLQNVRGYSALETGLAMLPAAVSIALTSLLFAPRLITRFGPRAVLATGLLMLLAARVFLVQLPVDAGYLAWILPPMLLTAGGGLVLPAVTGLGMSASRPDDAGVVSGVLNTGLQVGMALGVAVLMTLSVALVDGTGPQALTETYRWAFGGGAVLLALSLVVTLALLRPPARDSAPTRTIEKEIAR